MKKIFIEPKMQRFELDIKENIASSLINTTDGYGVYSLDNIWDCIVHDTEGSLFFLAGKYGLEAARVKMESCRNVASSDYIVPAEEAMKYMGW